MKFSSAFTSISLFIVPSPPLALASLQEEISPFNIKDSTGEDVPFGTTLRDLQEKPNVLLFEPYHENEGVGAATPAGYHQNGGGSSSPEVIQFETPRSGIGGASPRAQSMCNMNNIIPSRVRCTDENSFERDLLNRNMPVLYLCRNFFYSPTRMIDLSRVQGSSSKTLICLDDDTACTIDGSNFRGGSGSGRAVDALFLVDLSNNPRYQTNLFFCSIQFQNFKENRVFDLKGRAVFAGFQGCTFEKNGSPWSNINGGVARFGTGARAEFDQCIFTNNQGRNGAVMMVTDDATTVLSFNSDFLDNTARNQGGVVFITSQGGAGFVNGRFLRNEARFGGAFYASDQAVVSLQGCNMEGNLAQRGGVLHIMSESSSVFRNCEFRNNKARKLVPATGSTAAPSARSNTLAFDGGVIYASGSSSAQLSNSVLEQNTAARDGAVLWADAKSKVNVLASRLDSNTAENGGVLYLQKGANAIMADCFMSYNTAVKNGGILNAQGLDAESLFRNCTLAQNKARSGGVVHAADLAKTTLQDCTIRNNKAMYLRKPSGAQGGVVSTVNGTTTQLTRCMLQNNRANGNGGVISAFLSANINLDYCTLQGNQALDGGVLHAVSGGTADFSDSIFESNLARVDGGVMYAFGESTSVNLFRCDLRSNLAKSSGGVLNIFDRANAVFQNCDFRNSTADEGGVVYAWNTGQVTFSQSNTLRNNRATAKGGAIYVADSAKITYYDGTGAAAAGTTTSFSRNRAAVAGDHIFDATSAVRIQNCGTTSGPRFARPTESEGTVNRNGRSLCFDGQS